MDVPFERTGKDLIEPFHRLHEDISFWFCPVGSWNMIFRSTACVQHLCKECHTSATTDMRVSLYSWCTFTFDGDTLEQSYFPSFWSKNKNDAVVLTSWRVLQSNQSWPTKGKSSREMRTLNCTCVNTRSFNITEIVLICLVSLPLLLCHI